MAHLSVPECAERYVLARVARGEISAESRRAFRKTLRLFAESVGKNRLIGSISRKDIERWLGGMTGAPATKSQRLSILRGMLVWAVVEGYAKADPTVGIRGPKKTRTATRGLSDVDCELILAGADDARERLILTLMLEEGLRAGGVAGLCFEDIDFVDATMVVTEKGGHSRQLPVTTEVFEAINAYMATRPAGDGPLIRSRRTPAKGVSQQYISQVASVAIKRAGIAESGHALRHTCAHRLIDRGATLEQVRDVLGHQSIVTTQIYTGRTNVATMRPLMERCAH